MSETSDRYSTIADGFTARLEATQPDAWSAPSPCAEWTALDIVIHVINTHRRTLSVLDGSDPPVVSSDDDLSARWEEATREVLEALNDGRAATTVGGGYGDQPFESLVGRLLCADTLVHTWDLARATHQEERLDPQAVSKAMGFLTPLDEAIRRPGGFGPKIDPPADADDQTTFLNFCGRRV